MQEFAPLVLTSSRIAEVGAFKDVTFGAASALFAVTLEAESAANQRPRGGLGVGVGAVGLCAMPFSKMKTVRHALGGEIMG